MKTILALSLLAALSAFVIVVPFSFEVGVSGLFVAGLVAFLVADYADVFRPMTTRVYAETPRSERFRLAA